MTASLFDTSQIRQAEHIAINTFGISESELMLRAGKAAFTIIKQRFPHAQKIVVYCGSGNNAGDGFVLARLACQSGYSVIIIQSKTPEQLPHAAKEAAIAALSLGIPCYALQDFIEIDADLIVDALLGIGLEDDVREPISSAINQINDSKLPIIALDIPSGLNANTGYIRGVSVRATLTITFIACKMGMMTFDGPDCCGEIICHDLNIRHSLASLKPKAQLLRLKETLTTLSKRKRNCHKGDFGHILLIGGGEGMPGALHLAANAALRVGAGAVSIATSVLYANQALSHLPEAMIYGISKADDLLALIQRATVAIIGPGLGLSKWASELFKHIIASHLPVIIDASALRILAQSPQQDNNWILTPHPGEAAALLGCTTLDVQRDRFHSISCLQTQFGGNIVLKGTGSLVRTDKNMTYVCSKGNAGMATAGMGDVLSGVIGGLLAQGLSLAEAAKYGVWLHAHAADLAVKKHGERGLLASDLMPYLRMIVNLDSESYD